MNYKLSYVDLNYQRRKIINILRTNGNIVEKLQVIYEERNSYENVTKTIFLTQTNDIVYFNKHHPFENSCGDGKTIGKWMEEHCPPLYRGRKDLYSEEDIEHPLYTKVMSMVTTNFNPYGTYFYGREVTDTAGLNGQCLNLVIVDLYDDEIEELNGLFNDAYKL